VTIGADDLLARLVGARGSGRAVAPPSAARPLSLAEAYDVQDRLRAALGARGDRVIGWKAGFTSAATQAVFGATEPVCGFLLASGLLADGAEVPLARFAGLAVEAEVAFVMRRDLAGPGVSPAQALAAVEGARPALELVDFRFTGKPVVSDLVADGVFAHSIVLGAPLRDVADVDLAAEGFVYELNGSAAATGTTAAVMGSPLNSLAWIANHLGARGLALRAGDLVMSGSVSDVLRPKAGDRVRAAFPRLGAVSARFV
jgi:2-keto-4-pentenoate hydratase